MTLQDWFEAALALPPEARAAYLDAHCPDPAQRAQVEALLRADARLAGTDSRRLAAAPWLSMLAGGLRPGDSVGIYRLCEPLGQGGMGVVFRAERSDGLGQQVAIKIVRPLDGDGSYQQRFEQERRALAALDHPYIARLIDADALPDGTPYVVMEYVQGVAIDVYCRRQQLNLRARVELLRRVGQAVAHAHRHLIVHRDLKPSNILVGDDGLPKLLDFGIAKRLEAEAWQHTATAQRFFSPRYAAPEQFRGGHVQVGADLYALGMLSYELLAETPAFEFEGLSFGEIERLVVELPAPAPSTRARTPWARALRGDLDDITLTCLRKRPEERYETVAQWVDELGAWLQGMPIRSRGGHRWYRLRKFAARHRVAVLTGALSLLALAAAGVLLWQQNQALRAQRDLAQSSLSILQDAFAAADPVRAAGPDVTARQVLDSAKRKLEPLAQEQPDLYANLAGTIARVDLSLGRAADAGELLARADQAADVAALDAGTRFELGLWEARARMQARQLPEARQRLNALIPSEDQRGRWMAVDGRLRSLEGDHAGALLALDRAIALLGAEDDEEWLTWARYGQAEAHGLSGAADAELRSLEATLAWQRERWPADHPQLLPTRLRRLVALHLAQQHATAVTEAQALLIDVQRIFGEDTAEAAYVYNTLGRSLESLQRSEEALDAYRHAHASSSRAAGRDHPNTLRMHFNLAYSLGAAGAIDEAEQAYQELLRLAAQRLSPDTAILAYYRMHAASFLAEQGRVEAALRALDAPDWQLAYAKLSRSNQTAYQETLSAVCAAANAPDTSCQSMQRRLAPP